MANTRKTFTSFLFVLVLVFFLLIACLFTHFYVLFPIVPKLIFSAFHIYPFASFTEIFYTQIHFLLTLIITPDSITYAPCAQYVFFFKEVLNRSRKKVFGVTCNLR